MQGTPQCVQGLSVLSYFAMDGLKGLDGIGTEDSELSRPVCDAKGLEQVQHAVPQG